MAGLVGLFGFSPVPDDSKNVKFWEKPDRAGWLLKQGEYFKTWRKRWFVLKDGRMFWFMDNNVTKDSAPRGVINVGKCLTIKGAEDILNRPYAFELSTNSDTLFFIADSDKEKEDWINSVGRAIVKHSRSVTDYEVYDYDSKPRAPASAATPVSSAEGGQSSSDHAAQRAAAAAAPTATDEQQQQQQQ